MPLPIALAWTLGAVGAAAIAKLVTKEWQRVNQTLHARKPAPAENIAREKLPKLRRDPRTGIYRPE
jgi:hypothetical protein